MNQGINRTQLSGELGVAAEAIGGLSALPELLLAWYDQNARKLPWRSEPTPYRVYLSEIMLQQTRIETALPYFERFVAELPDVAALANVDEARLFKLWEGLGYYNRASNLQKAARVMVEQFEGRIPASYEALLSLPGIGDYTAGAIASMAFGVRAPAVDGNVLRVLSRVLACRADIAQPRVKAAFREAVVNILPEERAGDFNQALMDLGATVCLPNGQPRCEACPLAAHCAGYAAGCAAGLPVKSGAKPRVVEKKTVFVIAAGGRVRIRQRPSTGLLPSLWEFPNCGGGLDEQQALEQVRKWGCKPLSVEHLRDAKHVFTHIEWHMRGFFIRCEKCEDGLPGKWADAHQLRSEYAVPSAFSAYLKSALERLGGE